MFAHIDRAGTRLTELARRANMTPQAMGELVDDLELRGYLTREPDTTDRRAKRIVLTARGHAAIDAGLRTIAGIERGLEQKFGKREMQRLRVLLGRIVADDSSRVAGRPKMTTED